ncbi:MFS transporter [Chloroflexota bacterium]
MLVICSLIGNVVVAFGIFLPSITNDLGWSRSLLSAPFTAFWIVMGMLGPVAGASAAKFGPRKNMIIGNFIIVLGMLGMSRVTEIWQVFLFFSICIGCSQAFGGFIPANSVVTNWFIKRRALAISILSASGGVGALIFAPLLGWFISTYGWRPAWIMVAIIHFILAVVLSGLLLRNKPEDMGQTPDGETLSPAEQLEAANPSSGRVYYTPVDWKVRDALRTPAFWLMLAFASATMFTMNFLALHQVAYLQDLNYTPIMAATATGVYGGMSIVGQLTNGALGTRFEIRHIASVCLVGILIGLTILMNARVLPLVYLYTVVTGFSCGGIIVVLPILLGSYYGRTNYARILGFTTPVTTIFSAGSPLLAAFIFDNTGSYTPVFIIALCLLGVGLVCSFFARPPRPAGTVSGSLPQE